MSEQSADRDESEREEEQPQQRPGDEPTEQADLEPPRDTAEDVKGGGYSRPILEH